MMYNIVLMVCTSRVYRYVVQTLYTAMIYIHGVLTGCTAGLLRREASSESRSQDVYVLTDPRQVEILSRCCRVWVDRDTLDKDAVNLATKVSCEGRALP